MTLLEILPRKRRSLARHPHPPRPTLVWIVDLPRAGREAGAPAADNLLLEAALVRLEARKDVGRGGAPHEALAEDAEEEEAEEEPEAKRH